MGWQDAPEVSTANATPAWQSAPVVGEQPAAPKSKLSLADLNPMTSPAMGDAALSLASGAIATPIAGLSGMAAAFAKALGISDTEAADVVRKVQDHLTIQPKTAGGQAIASTVSAPFEALANVGDKAGAKVADVTGSPALGAATNTAIQAVPMVVGKVPKIAGAIAPELVTKFNSMEAAAKANRAKIASLEAPVLDGIDGARAAGYVVTPSSEGAGGVVSRTVEGMAGEPKTAKLFSKKNQATTNDLARRDVGLPEDAPISREALDNIREEAGQAYDTVKNIGAIQNDAKYFRDLADVSRSYDTAAKSYPHRSANPLQTTLDGLKQTVVDSASAIEEVKNLRREARDAYANRKAGLGDAYRKMAQAIDDAIERDLNRQVKAEPDKQIRAPITIDQPPTTPASRQIGGQRPLLEHKSTDIVPAEQPQLPARSGGPTEAQPSAGGSIAGEAPPIEGQYTTVSLADAVQKYREARTRIAKTYLADKALNETTGNIDGAAYARALKKGEPLSGAGLQIAQFARQFPRLAQVTERLGSTGPTYFDLLAAGVSKDALLIGARPIARHILASKPAQALITGRAETPSIYDATRGAAGVQDNPGVIGTEMGAEQRRKRANELLGGLQ